MKNIKHAKTESKNISYKIISFLKLLESSLYGKTIEFSNTTSAGTVTSLPENMNKYQLW